MRIVIVTGLSGAGKSTAVRALEDLEYYCVDNIPVPLLSGLLDTLDESDDIDHVALAIDSRQASYLGEFAAELGRLRDAGHDVEVLFLEASDEILLRRFKETRRRHPLSGDNLVSGIRRDREVMAPLHEGAAVVDTSSLNVHQLKGIIEERYGRQSGRLAVTMLSFGFKHGLPREADVVFDVRFLPNPYFDAELSGKDGRDAAVADFVFDGDDKSGAQLFEKLRDLIEFTLPLFEREGKQYLTIAVGCTGGRHRSVAMVEALSGALGEEWNIRVRHRDLERAG